MWCLHIPISFFQNSTQMFWCPPTFPNSSYSWRRWEGSLLQVPNNSRQCLWISKYLMPSLWTAFPYKTFSVQLNVPDPSIQNTTAGLSLLTSSPSGWRQFTAGQMASSSSESSCSENDISEGNKWLSLERCISKSRSRSLSSLLVQRSLEWFSFSFFFLGVLIFFTLALFSSQKLSLSKRRFNFLSM